jgi:hypothetical protein
MELWVCKKLTSLLELGHGVDPDYQAIVPMDRKMPQ